MTDRFLVIDDLRTLKPSALDGWDAEAVYARTSKAGMEMLTAEDGGDYTVICLDHDLGVDRETYEEDNIMPCVDYITEHADKFSQTCFYVHTSNPYAGDAIVRQLGSEGLFTVRVAAGDFFTGGW